MNHCLRDLQPEEELDLFLPKLKIGSHNQGNLQQALRKANKYPEVTRRFVDGDPVNLIDWRSYARTDTLLIREKREQLPSTNCIILRDSPSMHWPAPQDHDGTISKIELAKRIAFNLCYNLVADGNSCYIQIEGRSYNLKTRGNVLDAFHSAVNGQENLPTLLQGYQDQSRHSYDECFVVGDFFDLGTSELDEVSYRQAYFIQTLSSLETDLSWIHDNTMYSESPHDSSKHLGNTLLGNGRYQDEFNRWYQNLKKKSDSLEAPLFSVTERSTISEYINILGSRFEL